MIRVILVSFDFLTPFDLRTETFRVNVELSIYSHGNTRTHTFSSQEVTLGHFSKILEQINIDLENFSPLVKWGQKVIWSKMVMMA